MIAYSVNRRTQEMGIRMALGARERQLTGMVLGKALMLALAGVIIGLFAAAGPRASWEVCWWTSARWTLRRSFSYPCCCVWWLLLRRTYRRGARAGSIRWWP